MMFHDIPEFCYEPSKVSMKWGVPNRSCTRHFEAANARWALHTHFNSRKGQIVDGVVDLTVWISDLDGDPVDLEVSWAVEGESPQVAAWAPGGHGTNGLTTEQGRFDPAGAPHLLRWDVSEMDASASVRFTFAPHDGEDAGLEVVTPAFVPADGIDGAVGVE